MSETLPQGWEECSLKEVVKPRVDKVSPTTFPDSAYIGLEDVEAHTSTILGYKRASEYKSASARFEAGDVLYGRLRPYLNKVAKPDFNGLASAEFIVLPPSPAIKTDYLKRLISSPDFLKFTALLSTGDRPRVDFGQIGNFPVSLPPLEEQKRIVAKLDALLTRSTRARDELARIPRLIERYKQAVLAAAFRGDLTADWRGTSQLVGWRELPFSELVESYQNGLSKRTSNEGDECIVLRLADISNQRIVFNSPRTIRLTHTERKRYRVQPSDILIVRVNGSKDIVGRFIPALPDSEYAYCDHFIRLKLIASALPQWVTYLGDTADFRKYINDHMVSSAGQNTVSQATLNTLPVILPPTKEQAFIVERLQTTFRAIEALGIELTKAEILRTRLEQATLAKAFRGELVPQDPDDEPASELLDRVRAEIPIKRATCITKEE